MAVEKNRYLGNISAILTAPAIRQLIFLLGIAGGVTVGVFLYFSIQEPTYRPLDYQVTQQNMASIIDTLDKSGIQYKVNEQDGLLYVAATDVQKARLKLSSAGIAKDDSFNFSYLNEQNSIGNSQFQENARYLRALESDLSRTIASIEGISAARVHIAMPQNNIFADENHRPTASIVVSLAPGLSSDKEKIRAIVQVIASSVPGLDPKDVAITDQYGHYLSSVLDPDALMNTQQLTYQNNLQSSYEKRIESMITPLLGDNKVNVRVYANLDFTQQEEAQEQYDPDKKVVRSEQTMSEQSGSAGASGAPGALANSPPESDSEKGSSGGQSSSASEGRNQSIKNYEITKSVVYKKSSHPKVTSLSVAVVVDNDAVYDANTKTTVNKPLDKDKLDKITEIVKATIGYDEKRGDKVAVVNSLFKTPEPIPEAAPLRFWEQPGFWDILKKLIGIPLGFILLFMLYKRLSTYIKTPPPASHRYIAEPELEDELTKRTNETHDVRKDKMNRLKELANKDPNRVALIIKNWVGK